jgi:hypothetical protein
MNSKSTNLMLYIARRISISLIFPCANTSANSANHYHVERSTHQLRTVRARRQGYRFKNVAK